MESTTWRKEKRGTKREARTDGHTEENLVGIQSRISSRVGVSADQRERRERNGLERKDFAIVSNEGSRRGQKSDLSSLHSSVEPRRARSCDSYRSRETPHAAFNELISTNRTS